MKIWKSRFINKISLFSFAMVLSMQTWAVGLTTDTIYESNFETGINIPATFVAEYNAVFSENLAQYTNLPEGTNVTGHNLTMYDEATQSWVTPPAWVWISNPLDLDWVAEQMWSLPLKVEVTTDNSAYPIISDNFNLDVVDSWGGTVNIPPVLVVEAHAIDGTIVVPVDETDPYNQWADYTLPAFQDLIIDTTNSSDPNDPNNPNDDGTVDHLTITSNISWVIHDGTVQSVMIPRLSSLFEELTIEITDNGGKKTTSTKIIFRL